MTASWFVSPWPVRASIGGGGIVAHDVGESRYNGIVDASSRGVPHRLQVRAWKMLLPVVAVNLFRVSSVSAFHLFQVFHLFQALRHPPSWKMLVIEVGGDNHDRQLVRVAVEGVPHHRQYVRAWKYGVNRSKGAY